MTKLTVSKAKKAVGLYLTGLYTYQMVADFTGLSYGLIRKLMVFHPPYDQFSSLFTAEELEELAKVRQERRCTCKLSPPTVRKIRRILNAGNYGTRQELAESFDISRAHLYKIERREVHDYE
jgi:hypothetical protein